MGVGGLGGGGEDLRRGGEDQRCEEGDEAGSLSPVANTSHVTPCGQRVTHFPAARRGLFDWLPRIHFGNEPPVVSRRPAPSVLSTSSSLLRCQSALTGGLRDPHPARRSSEGSFARSARRSLLPLHRVLMSRSRCIFRGLGGGGGDRQNPPSA